MTRYFRLLDVEIFEKPSLVSYIFPCLSRLLSQQWISWYEPLTLTSQMYTRFYLVLCIHIYIPGCQHLKAISIRKMWREREKTWRNFLIRKFLISLDYLPTYLPNERLCFLHVQNYLTMYGGYVHRFRFRVENMNMNVPGVFSFLLFRSA